MELKIGSIVIYENFYSELINQNIKIDNIVRIKDKLFMTKQGDKLHIEQIRKNVSTNEENPKYISNWILKQKNNLLKKIIK